MKYTINGFSQKKLIECGLDLVDSMILRWFIDFKDTNKMKAKIIDDIPYYWIYYEKLIEDIPIIGIKNKEALFRRFKKMINAKILLHKVVRSGGVFSYFALGPEYECLINDNSKSTQKSEQIDSSVDECRLKSRNKDRSIINRSININNIYKSYPSKCPVSKRPTGKCSKNKKQIEALLKKGIDNLEYIINRYIKECTENKIWIKNFSTFLNNLPDYAEEESEKTKGIGMSEEEKEFHKRNAS